VNPGGEDSIPIPEEIWIPVDSEVAAQLKAAAGGRGDTILSESHTWTDRAAGKGTTDRVPSYWRFTEARLDDIVSKLG